MSIRSAAMWAMSSYYTAFVIQFATSVVLARFFISPAELGLFTIAFAAVTLVSFLQDFGVNKYITGEKDLTAPRIRSAMTVSVTVGACIGLLAVAMAWPASWLYDEPALVPIMLVIGLGAFMTPLTIVPQALRQRELDFRANAGIELSATIANALVALTLAWQDWGAMALACGYLAQQFTRMAIAQWLAGGVFPFPLRYEETRPVIALGGTNTALSICASIQQRAPELLIGHAIGNAATGLFARAGGLTHQLRTFMTGAVGAVIFPAFRQVRDRGEPLGKPYLRVTAFYTAVIWPAMAGMALLAEPFVRFLYGELWIGAAPLLSCLALAQMLHSALPASSDLPILLGEKSKLVRRNVMQTAAAVALLFAALPFGLWWVAASRIGAGLVFVLLFIGFTRSLAQFRWRELALVYLQSALATAAAIVPALLLYRYHAGPAEMGFVGLLLSASLGALAWLACLALTAHPAWREIRGMAAPIIARLPLARRRTKMEAHHDG